MCPVAETQAFFDLLQVQVDGRLLDIVDDDWKKVRDTTAIAFPFLDHFLPLQEKLPDEDIAVPIAELPDPEADNGSAGESMKEQENKWTDLGLQRLSSEHGTQSERQ